MRTKIRHVTDENKSRNAQSQSCVLGWYEESQHEEYSQADYEQEKDLARRFPILHSWSPLRKAANCYFSVVSQLYPLRKAQASVPGVR